MPETIHIIPVIIVPRITIFLGSVLILRIAICDIPGRAVEAEDTRETMYVGTLEATTKNPTKGFAKPPARLLRSEYSLRGLKSLYLMTM
jgi:hypothetical protein